MGQCSAMHPDDARLRPVSLTPDELRRKALRKATDNDGLWEFAQIIRDDATGQEAYEQLRPVMVELVHDGLLTIEDGDGVRFRDDEAQAVLEERSSWVLPWEAGGDWHTGADAFGVSLTSDGEAALDQTT
jgi:hypothetical protein